MVPAEKHTSTMVSDRRTGRRAKESIGRSSVTDRRRDTVRRKALTGIVTKYFAKEKTERKIDT